VSDRGAPLPGEDPEAERPLLELSGRARDLLAALTERKDEAGALYEGALRVLANRENPARIRLAACGLRELLDEFQDAPKGEKLGNRVKKLKERWEVAGRTYGAAPASHESGFTETLDEFFLEFERDYPARRSQASDTIGRLDPSGRTAPPVVHRARGTEWMDFSGYFSGVLHGGKRPTEEAFVSQLETFERFLLDWLRPRTFTDLGDIDSLIAEGPPGV
jgi:hypothetical protein